MNPLSGLKLAAGITVATAGGLALYARTLRPKHVRWGARDDEIRRPMPLDDRVTGATYVTNRAVTVRARPDEIWLWLAQIGESPRAGYYSYEWVERLMGMDVKNADAIFPEYQHPKAGDVLDRGGMMGSQGRPSPQMARPRSAGRSLARMYLVHRALSRGCGDDASSVTRAR